MRCRSGFPFRQHGLKRTNGSHRGFLESIYRTLQTEWCSLEIHDVMLMMFNFLLIGFMFPDPEGMKEREHESS